MMEKLIATLEHELDELNWNASFTKPKQIKIIANKLIKYEQLAGKEYQVKSREDSII